MNKILTLTACTLAIAFSGCIKKPEDATKNNFGPEVKTESIASSISDAYGPQDLNQIKLGEFVYRELSQQVYSNPPSIVSKTAETVTSRTEDTSTVTINVVTDNEDDRETPPKKWTTEQKYTFDKVPSSSSGSDSSSSSSDSSSSTGPKITYHNLKVARVLEDPPDLVLSQSNCAGLANCKINVVNISYDEVVWDSNNNGTRYAHTLKISSEAPILARKLQECMQQSVTIPDPKDSSKVIGGAIVTICDKVRNFMYQQ